MLTVAEALEKILATIAPLDVTEQPLEESLGLTLSEEIRSVIDSPPFDKSLMDGYAVRLADVATGVARLRVIEIVTAGSLPTKEIGPGEATQIMTGAPLPAGTDLVIKVEETTRDGDDVSIETGRPAAGMNMSLRGTSVRAGDSVLTAGLTLNASRIGALAELGRTSVRVRRRPRVAILATGDELVSIDKVPGPGQIRNSNGMMLAAQIAAIGGLVVPLGIARDVRDDLRSKIVDGLKYDLLILSGGVSAGTLDLVPGTLADAGVTEVFHKVEMKPGKPIWFGVCQSPAKSSCYVFGLPGNPVSSLVCCELFVRTAIKRLMGIDPATPLPILAKLEHDYSTKADRPTYHPARLTWTTEGLAVTLVPCGSSDLCGIVAANGMAYFSGEARQFRIGDHVETFAW